MSDYFRTLLRFEKARSGQKPPEDEPPAERRTEDDHRRPEPPPPAGERRGVAGGPEDPHQGIFGPPPRRRPPRRRARRSPFGFLRRLWPRRGAAAESPAAIRAHGQLLDSLRAADTRYSAPGVVLAAAGGQASVRQVIDGLVRQARSLGVKLTLAEMVIEGDERVLRGRDTEGALPTATALELTGGSDPVLRDWFERATAGCDLLVVEGPPLTRSVDAALLARSGDGLVIVLEPLATQREDFDTAIERARASGCFVLGLVMSHHRHWLPRFLRGFFDTYPKSIRTRPRRSGE